MNQRIGLAIATALGVTVPVAANALPLQPGVYSSGSKYIQIASQGDRWCFQGFTARATSIASLIPDPKQPNLYRLHKIKDAVIRQEQPQVLAYGSESNFLPYTRTRETSEELTAEMQQCLKTKTPYFKRIQSTR